MAQPDYTITKTLNTADPVRKGEVISFTIRITNTGDLTITKLPLRDVYVNGFLNYIKASPVPDNPQADQLTWTDLTQAGPTGFGQDLDPGDIFTIVVEFIGAADTTNEPDGATKNTATVEGAEYDPDGSGPQPPTGPLPTKSDDAPVRIYAPTAVAVAEYGVIAGETGIDLYWNTIDETNIAMFRLYRVISGKATLLATLPAEKVGQPDGTRYTHTDTDVVGSSLQEYWLEIIGVDGSLSTVNLGSNRNPGQIFLPMLQR